jgi:GT2 family glycosyltransferase
MNDDLLAFDRSPSIVPGKNERSADAPELSGVAPVELIHEGNSASAMAIQVSVVVPTCGRPQLLKQCLDSLLRQEFDQASYEIIVVDDGPSAATRAAVVECVAQAAENSPVPRVAYIASPGPHGPAAARNYGWHAACGALIAFTDDDTIASPAWLSKGLLAFGPDVKAVWGKIEMPLDGTPTDYERDAKGLETAEFVTANCFCPKQALEQIDGFDERFRFAWREDADLYFRLLGLGGRVVHAPDALITHPIRPAPWGVSIRQQKKIQSDALLYKKHPGLYRRKIRSGPRWDYYLIVACIIVFLIALPFGKTMLAAAAGAIWLFLTLRFCAMRLSGTAKTPSHIAEMLVTSAVIPPLAVFWRMVGAWKFRVALI